MKVSYITKYLSEVKCLGIDIDGDNQFKLLKAYFNARWLAEHLGGRVKLTKTGKGYHIKIVGVKTNIHHRCGLEDDKERIWLSELRGGIKHADDVLFDVKWGKRNTEELDDDWILRLPFWFMPRRKPKSIWRRVK